MMAYRSAVQDTTGYSPNQMMLGRETELPIDIVMGHPEEGVIEGNQHTYVDRMKEKMSLVYDLARQNIQMKSNHQKRNYDLKSQVHRYEPGDAVWLHNPARKKGVSPKLSRPWEGPFRVINRLSDVTYRIQKSVKAVPKVVHFDRLKLYTGDNPPVWKDKETIQMEVNDDLDETVLYTLDEYPHITEEKQTEKCKKVKDKVIKKKKLDNVETISDVEIEATGITNEPYITVRSKRTVNKPVRYRDS
jgi:hypothetical protein